MEENRGQDRKKWYLALGGLVGLCVVALLCVVVLGGSMLSGQGGSAQRDGRDARESSGPTTGGADGPVATKGNNELVLLGIDPPTLDPALASDATSAGYIVELYSGLVTLDLELDIVPDLAKSWEISDDGMLYTFTLTEGAAFANGDPITAEDFKYSIERTCDPATQSPVADSYLGDIVGCREKLRGESREVSGVQVVDDQTLTIQIDAPKVYFLAKLTYPTAFVVDQETIEQEGRLWASKEPNGSGPFKLGEYSFGERIVLVPNTNYYGSPKPAIERVTYILSGGSGMTLYETDEIDITGVGIADIDRVLDDSNPLSADVHPVEDMNVTYIGLNQALPPFDDPLVRQAFNLALDKETLIRVVGRGVVTPAYGVLPPGMPGNNPELKGLRFDPERARELLAQSKYGGPEGLPDIALHMSGQGGTPSEEIEAIVEMWKQNLGVEVSIEQTEWATFLFDTSRKPNPYQAFSVGWIADYPDPQNFLDILFHCDSQDNKIGYCNAEVDALLEEARVEKDEARRTELYQQIEQVIVDEAAWVPLWHNKGYVLIKPWVTNFPTPSTIVPRLKYVEIAK